MLTVSKRKTDNLISYGIIFGKLSRLKILIKRGNLTIINAKLVALEIIYYDDQP